ncbi:hypothetical protein KSX49_21980 [Phocaeicola dorei]|uniref:hypothetical protein n=1 Tax=Phocaeicola dorei TaxID=357276 RepID=UPI001C394F59|nr:hypothetical protein [Phocaeicola dorei]MBV3583890.1 hypothetical protein [Phocaeicola dorei]MBV3608640.1 hypothetical protein [Phocaeicola dorei]
MTHLLFMFAQHAHILTGVSPPMCPDNGKHTANGKGVHRELESANIWSDAQKLDMKA